MSQHHDSPHGAGDGMEWWVTHTAGFIMPFGKAFEGFLEKTMYFVVNGYFKKIATIYLVVFSPLLFLEFFFHYIGLS